MSDELCYCSYCDAHGPQLLKSECSGWKPKPKSETATVEPKAPPRIELTLGLGMVDVVSAHVEGDGTPCLSLCMRVDPAPIGALTMGPGIAIDNDTVRLVFLNVASVDCVIERLQEVRAKAEARAREQSLSGRA